MSKLKEQIIKSIDLQNGTFIDKDSNVQPFQPRNAYLLPKEEGTHERWVTDDNGAISKQAGSGSSLDQDNIPRLITLTLDDLGMTSSNTEAEINQALADYINGLELTIGEKDLYFFQVVTDTIKKTYLIKDQGKGIVENLTPDKLIDIASGGGNSNPLIEVTYDELLNLKNTSSLVKGQNYLLTDYETTYIQPVTNVSKSSGVIEPLIITATDVNKLHNQCKSTLYPQDIVFYEITGDIGNGYGTEGFTKGKIYRRIDTLRNNDIGTDWRHVKYDRNGVDKLLFEDYTGCYNNDIKTYFLFNMVVGKIFQNNIIGNFSKNNTFGFTCTNNKIGDSFTGNTLGNYFQNNTIGNNFQNNNIGRGFYNNGTSTTPFLSNNTEFRNSMTILPSTTQIQNQNIDVVVFKSPNGTKKQRYYDDSNNLVINNL